MMAMLAGVALAGVPARIVALGTSLTANATWPAALQAELRSEGYAAVVETVAGPGITSKWGLAQLGRVAALHPDVVLLEFAVNDASLWRGTSLRRSRARIVAIIGGLERRLPGVCLAIMAMNPVFGLHGWLRPMLDRYNDAHLRDAQALGVAAIDFRPDWRRLPANELARIIADGVHPDPVVAARVMMPRLARQLAGLVCAQLVP